MLWFYFFPGTVVYIFGSREGTVWTILSFLVPSVVLFTDVGADYPLAFGARFAVTYGLVGALAVGLQRGREARDAELSAEKAELRKAMAQVRTLGEMLPMCAWCGKVRDDEGYWSRIEEYLRNEAGTQVSHGICDECARRLDAGLGPESDRPPGADPGSAA